MELILLNQLRNTSSQPLHLIWLHMGNILTVYESLGIHFLQCWHPSETMMEHNPRRKVRWSLLGVVLHLKMFWFRKTTVQGKPHPGQESLRKPRMDHPIKACTFTVFLCAVFLEKDKCIHQIIAQGHSAKCSQGLRGFPFVNSNFNTIGTSGLIQKAPDCNQGYENASAETERQ